MNETPSASLLAHFSDVFTASAAFPTSDERVLQTVRLAKPFFTEYVPLDAVGDSDAVERDASGNPIIHLFDTSDLVVIFCPLFPVDPRILSLTLAYLGYSIYLTDAGYKWAMCRIPVKPLKCSECVEHNFEDDDELDDE